MFAMRKTWIWLCAATLSSSCSSTSAKLELQKRPPPAARADRSSPEMLDDFEQPLAWQAMGSDGVSASREQVDGRDGHAVRLSFDFHGHGGYAALRRALPLTLPDHYEISFELMGDAPVNDFQFKLIDASGENVWWFRRSDFAVPKSWQRIAVKQRQVEFAW